MIQIVLFSRIEAEISCIRRALTAYSVQHSWADCQVEAVTEPAHLMKLQQTADILISDVSDPTVVEFIKATKAKYPPIRVFPIAGPEVPPTMYVCPEIMPCGLFWRPVSSVTAEPVVEQMMALVHDQAIPPSQDSFRISGKQKIQDVPFSSILYFEAREKKVFLRMQEQELAFASTLSKLEEDLPSEFVRCHKSFIINMRHILTVDRTNGSVVLDNRMEIPISRSYRKALLEEYHGNT